jgi:hypothetical protein
MPKKMALEISTVCKVLALRPSQLGTTCALLNQQPAQVLLAKPDGSRRPAGRLHGRRLNALDENEGYEARPETKNETHMVCFV